MHQLYKNTAEDTEYSFQGFRFRPDACQCQSVERLTAEREVAGSIPGVGPILRVLKSPRNEGTGPSRGSDDHVKWRSRLH